MKKKLRDEIIKRREELTEEFIKEYSEDLSEVFFNSELYKNSKIIMSYASIRGEFDTNFIHKKIIEDKKTLLLPKTYEEGVMKAFEVRDLQKLKKNSLGILEPLETKENVPDLIIVPGVAFDGKGNRLGFGGGFYDRFLFEHKAKTVALCYEFQVVNSIPKEEHDVEVDEIYYLSNN